MKELDKELIEGIIPNPPPPDAPAVEQVEWFDDRYYKVLNEKGEEIFLPSVTTILGIINKPFLSRWRGDVGNEAADHKMNYAAWRGSRIHDAIHRGLIRDKQGNRAPIQMAGFEGTGAYKQDEWIQIIRFQEFMATLKPEVLQTEAIVFNLLNNYAGTMDLLCELKAGEYTYGKRGKVTIPADGMYVGDIKTGKAIDDEYHFQTAAYAAASELQGHVPVVGTFVLHLNNDSQAGWKMHMRNADETLVDLEQFHHARSLWFYKNTEKQPQVFTMPTVIQL